MDSEDLVIKNHWGEIEEPVDEEVKEINLQALEETLCKLSVDGAMKLHQPYSAEDGSLIEISADCGRMEENVVQSIKLLEKIRNHYGFSSSTLSSLPEAERNVLFSEDPPMETDEAEQSSSNLLKFKMRQGMIDMDRGYSLFNRGHRAPPDLRPQTARKLLLKTVSALIAQTGYDTAMSSSLEVMTDAANYFLQKITKLLRVAVDKEAETGPHGFPDAVEWAFFEAGLGSITNLHDYYQHSVLGHKTHLQRVVAALPQRPTVRPTAVIHPEPIRVTIKEEVQEEEDNVPEIHFPALGNGDTSEEMHSTLEPGFQMLHSLEEEALG